MINICKVKLGMLLKNQRALTLELIFTSFLKIFRICHLSLILNIKVSEIFNAFSDGFRIRDKNMTEKLPLRTRLRCNKFYVKDKKFPPSDYKDIEIHPVPLYYSSFKILGRYSIFLFLFCFWDTL